MNKEILVNGVAIRVNGRRSISCLQLLAESTVENFKNTIDQRKSDVWDHVADGRSEEIYRGGRYHDTYGVTVDAIDPLFEAAAKSIGQHEYTEQVIALVKEWFDNASPEDLALLADKSIVGRMGDDWWYTFEKEY